MMSTPSTQSLVSDTLLHSKDQDSLVKWLIPGLGQRKYKMNLEHSILQKGQLSYEEIKVTFPSHTPNKIAVEFYVDEVTLKKWEQEKKITSSFCTQSVWQRSLSSNFSLKKKWNSEMMHYDWGLCKNNTMELQSGDQVTKKTHQIKCLRCLDVTL